MKTIIADSLHHNLFGLEFDFDNVAFSIGDFSVYWYGIIIAVGFLIALVYGYKNADRYGINKDKMIDVVIVGLFGAIVCARAFSLIGDDVPLSSFGSFSEKMAYIFGIHDGGISILGSIIGAFVFGGLMAYMRKVNVLDMFDLAATGFLIGQVVGRWGNFVNQEVYGNSTGSEWFGIGGTRIGEELVHPLFLYEMLWNLAVFFVLHKMSKNRRFKGQIFLGYIVSYTFARYWLEGMRNTKFILKLGEVSMSQLFCIFGFIASLVVFIILFNRNKEKAKETGYTEVFGEMCDDSEVAAAAYELLGCEDESSDSEIEAAYNALREKYEAMLPEEGADAQTEEETLSKADKKKRERSAKKQAELEQSILDSDAPEADEEGMVEISEEELAVRAKARLFELERAYKYVVGYRELMSEERARFAQESEIEDEEDTEIEAD